MMKKFTRNFPFLSSEKVIEVCDVSVKNGTMGTCWVMMTKEKEEPIHHEMHTKYWSFNESKTAEVVTLLDLIEI